MSDPKEAKIWTPAARMNPNVGKMAWAMYLEAWKAWLGRREGTPWDSAETYEDCVKHAEAIEEFQNPKSEVPGL